MASRREFFKSIIPSVKDEEKESEPLVVRPPYAKDLSLFSSLCIECESKSCAVNCEEEIIIIQADGTPVLNFSKTGCTFCEECAKACEAGVLTLVDTQERVNATFKIDINLCIAHNATICFACKEPCIDDAILFNGMFNPVIDADRCTGCGFCMARCPVNAIEYEAVG